MSRIGNQPINFKSNIEFVISNSEVIINGPLGQLKVSIPYNIKINKNENQIFVSRINNERQSRANHGLIRSLIANAVMGVEAGFEKKLEMHGIGFKVTLNNNQLTLLVGFSHPVIIDSPVGITFEVEKNLIKVIGIDKQLVGEIAAKIRSIKKPEPYKGKGIRYQGEYVRRKAGKTAKSATS